MSTSALHPATRSRWMEWKPKASILADSARSEPTKPSKPGSVPGSVGFEGATPAESPEIEAAPAPAELARASAVLTRAGVRLMLLDGISTVGIWSDLDGPALREALRTFGSNHVRYLDGAGIPMRYKLRRVEGEPVPAAVLGEMEQHPEEPWTVRDSMLTEMGWCPKGTAWAEWKAVALKRPFREQGASGDRGCTR
jgi:hypothetical protein